MEALVDSAFEWMGDPVSFSSLRRLVGVEDAGKFNYHLGKRQPQFVENQDDGWFFQSIVPPRTAAERSVKDVATYAFRETQRDIEKLLDGVCMICGGPIATTTPSEDSFLDDQESVTTEFDCSACAFRMNTPIAVTLIRHPAVISHHYEHAVDIRNDPFFSPEFIRDDHTTLESTDPFVAHVDVPVKCDTITLRADEDLEAEVV